MGEPAALDQRFIPGHGVKIRQKEMVEIQAEVKERTDSAVVEDIRMSLERGDRRADRRARPGRRAVTFDERVEIDEGRHRAFGVPVGGEGAMRTHVRQHPARGVVEFAKRGDVAAGGRGDVILDRAELRVIEAAVIAFEKVLDPVRPVGRDRVATPGDRCHLGPAELSKDLGDILDLVGIELPRIRRQERQPAQVHLIDRRQGALGAIPVGPEAPAVIGTSQARPVLARPVQNSGLAVCAHVEERPPAVPIDDDRRQVGQPRRGPERPVRLQRGEIGDRKLPQDPPVLERHAGTIMWRWLETWATASPISASAAWVAQNSSPWPSTKAFCSPMLR